MSAGFTGSLENISIDKAENTHRTLIELIDCSISSIELIDCSAIAGGSVF